jgi:riboflavin biosynthesis pyrimidine reductase
VRWLKPDDDVVDLLAPYTSVSRHGRGPRPHVLANMVGGLDGTAAISGRVGALSDPTDARLFRELRSVADVVLVGAETVRRERYGPVRLDDALRAQRTAVGRAPVPRLAVVTRSLQLDWSVPLFADADPAAAPIIVTCADADPARLADAEQHADVVVAGASSVDVGRALGELHALGASVVLCEGGPRLLGELVAADLLDELCLSIAPVMGGDPLPVAIVPGGGDLARFRLAHALVEESTLFLRYEHVR